MNVYWMKYTVHDFFFLLTYMFALRFILSNDLPSLFFPGVKKRQFDGISIHHRNISKLLIGGPISRLKIVMWCMCRYPYTLTKESQVNYGKCDTVCQWLATGRWFSPSPPVSSTNKTDRHDITEIFLKVALNTFKQRSKHKIMDTIILAVVLCDSRWV